MTRKLRTRLTNIAQLKYICWRIAKSPRTINLQLKSGQTISLRKPPADDIDTAWEIFAGDVYQSPRAIELNAGEIIHDLGANIGLSCIYWAGLFENNQIIAYEPHPIHLRIAAYQIRRNGLERRIELRPFAVSNRECKIHLSDEGVMSQIGSTPDRESFEVFTKNIFLEEFGGDIGLMKMDIEGAEYDILDSSRFASLMPRCMVLEWHRRALAPSGKQWCKQRLGELGYETEDGAWNTDQNGFIWAYR